MCDVFRLSLSKTLWRFRYAWLSTWAEVVDGAAPAGMNIAVRMIPSGPYPIPIERDYECAPANSPFEAKVEIVCYAEEPVTYEAARRRVEEYVRWLPLLSHSARHSENESGHTVALGGEQPAMSRRVY